MAFVALAARVLAVGGDANRGNFGPGAGLAKIGASLGHPSLTRDDFIRPERIAGPPDEGNGRLDDLDLVRFQNVECGCALTGRPGRRRAMRWLRALVRS